MELKRLHEVSPILLQELREARSDEQAPSLSLVLEYLDKAKSALFLASVSYGRHSDIESALNGTIEAIQDITTQL